MRVLLVEDEPMARQRAASLLARQGHEAVVAGDGLEAWDLWRGGRYDAVLTDWVMPGLDGLELCRRIRAERRPGYSCVLVQTVRSGRTNFLAAMEAGADDFLEKPLDADALAARLRVAARIQGLYQELNQLRGLIPICSYCKKVRSDGNYWQQVEAYVAARSEALFSHTICPDCYEGVLRPEMDAWKRKARGA